MNESDKQLLIESIMSGDITEDHMVISMAETKKAKVDKVHKTAITELKGKNTRWQTYVGNRRKISAVNKEKLYSKLYDYYFVNVIPTLQELFPTWIESKIDENLAASSIRRYRNYWNKYYKDKKITSIPVNKISKEQIETFFHGVIRENKMTPKELTNMKYPFKELMRMSFSKGYIVINTFKIADIKKNGCRPPKKYADDSRIYLPKEKMKLFDQLNREIVNHPTVTDMHAIFLLFKLGVRIGEVVAIKKGDFDLGNREIHIQRMQRLVEDADGVLRPVVVEHLKAGSPHADRFLPLEDYEIELFNAVLSVNKKYSFKEGDYLFVDEDGRTMSRAIDNRLRKLCKKAHIPVKSSHDIRRTVASEMHTGPSKVPIELIRQYLGHSDVKRTWGYVYNNREKEETSRLITGSLKQMNGLKVTQ